MKRRTQVVGALVGSLLLGAAGLVGAEPASAVYVCVARSETPSRDGSGVHFGGRVVCTGSTAYDYRVRATLLLEHTNWGPIPNSWPTVSNAGWSRIFAHGATAYRYGWRSCSGLDNNVRTKLFVDVHHSHGRSTHTKVSPKRRVC